MTFETDYAYDRLGNLKTISQLGASGDTPKTRTFTYDSLSRLVQSYNPESGYICYGNTPSGTAANGTNCTEDYEPNGNLKTKTDARGIVRQHSYDSLDRVLSELGPGINNHYDYDGNISNDSFVTSNAVGRLVRESNYVDSDQEYAYDPMGRIICQRTCLPSLCEANANPVSAAYDLAGNMTDFTYPNRYHIQQTFSSSGRLATSSLHDINGTSAYRSYLEAIGYHPDGSAKIITLGNGVQQTIVKNNRLQVQSLTASTPLAPLNGHPFLSDTYCYRNCTSGGAANNGNIWQITNTLNSALTQDFTYDSLNRIKSFSVGGVSNQVYQADTFGNMTATTSGGPVSTFDPYTNRINNLPCIGPNAGPQYDNAGNLLCDGNSAVGTMHQYVYTSKGMLASVSNGTTTVASYTYDANSNRFRKLNADGSYPEYVYFGGEVMAEHHSDHSWSNLIYAGGQRIAKVDSTVPLVHAHGTDPTSGLECDARFATGINYVAKAGDMLSWQEYNGNAVAGIDLWLDSGGVQWAYADTDGHTINQDTRMNQWVSRTLDLGHFQGHTLQQMSFLKDVMTPAGNWDLWYGNMAITSTDGTVTQLIGSDGQVALSGMGCQGPSTNVAIAVERLNAPGIADTHFYLGDHLGTAQLEFSSGGWPLSQSQYTAFGQDITPQYTANTYKYTGLERDSESGLDHAQFRQLSSTVARWLSPDPYNGSMNLGNPQSLNRYNYVMNNPLRFTDPSGLDPCSAANAVLSAAMGIACIAGSGGSGDGGGFVAALIDLGELAAEFFGFHPHPKFHGSLKQRPNTAPSKPTPRICGGTFTYTGVEADAAEGGAFDGGITEYDSIDGNSHGSLVEGWLGGEGPLVGVGKITSSTDKSIFNGVLGFFGAGISAGPLAGIQVGWVGGNGWSGLYAEGHVGFVGFGSGAYLRSSCKAGG